MSTPRIDVTIAAPADAVWAALRERDQIRHWHGWDYEGAEAEIDLIYFQHFTADDEARTLDIQGGDVIALTEDGDRTRVRLTRAARGGDPEWDAYYEDITEGWTTFLHQLKFMLERRPRAQRRTLFRAGTGPSPAVELGIDGLTDGPFSANLAGDDVRGEVWFRSDHQLGVTVDAFGGDGEPGLLVVSHAPPTAARPAPAAMAVLSTYGLDDAAFADLDRRWTDWWSQRYRSDEVGVQQEATR